jgi:hypothetical protein
VSLSLDEDALEAVGGLQRLTDATSEPAGWDVSVEPVGGGATVVATKDYFRPEDVQRILRELAGADGPLEGVRLTVDPSLFTIESRFSGDVDLTPAAAGRFEPSDRALVAAMNRAGLRLDAAREAFGGTGDGTVGLVIIADLPGNEGHNAREVIKTVPRWTVTAGSRTVISATSTQGRWARIAPFSVAAIALVGASITAWRSRRRRRHRAAVPLERA